MTSVPIPGDKLSTLVADVGQLLGLLDQTKPNPNFDLDWFANPVSELRAIPGRRSEILKLLRDLLGTPMPNGPTDRSWYVLPWSDAPTPVYAVLPNEDDDDNSDVGVGILDDLTLGSLTVRATAYAPLFSLPIGTPIVVTGSANHPIELKLAMPIGQTITVPGVSFDGLAVTCDIYVGSTDPSPTFALDFLKGTTSQSLVTTLDGLRSSSVADWINAALATDTVQAWLNKTIGGSGITIGTVLTTAGILTQSSSKTAAAAGGYSLGSLSDLVGKSPLQIAEMLLAAVLKKLAANDKPLVSIGDGGIWVSATNDGTATDYALRFQVTDIALSKGQPSVSLQLGKMLSGDTDSSTWISRSDPNAPSLREGISLTLVSESGDTPPVPSFKPKLDLVSLGVDIKGADDKPLVDVKGVTLGGMEPRFAFSVDFLDTSKMSWGVGLQVDDLGIPLGSGLAGASGNPIAQNFLSTGAPDTPGDKEKVNPAFSAAISHVFNSTTSPTLNVQLEQDGAMADEVWIPMQRAFGPLQCRRVGLKWPQNNPNRVLDFLFDGGVSLAALAVDLQGLSLGLPLNAPGQLSEYTIDLQGLGVSYDTPELTIAGGFLKNTTASLTEYDGAALIRAANWSIGALGSYATLNGAPSLFIFAQLDAQLGGPPFFFVTGLCAGFGYNRSLKLPNKDEVPSFPLLAGIADPSKIGGKDTTPAQALAKLADWVPPTQGTDWFAAGVQFTSFELVQSNVVLAAIFGKDLQIALLGVSRIKLAQTGPQFAYAELGLDAVLHPSAGFFGVSAELTSNSYLLTKDCHLTGGFAFWIWYQGDHAGDFVVTLGGYHPAFQKPDHYPTEARLGFSWQVDGNLTIQGDSYFALTPSCAMGGGALDVEFHSGDLRAWFTAHADFLFTWKPFYFIGDVGVSIGASYKLDLLFTSVTVSVELGADLEIWGPPTGGRVHVSWYIISFTVGFGADQQTPDGFLSWQDFSSLLPQPNSAPQVMAARRLGADDPPPPVILTTSISDGLVRTDGTDWLVRGDAMTFAINTAFPVTAIVFDGATPWTYSPSADAQVLAVRPMGVKSLTSTMTITITGPDGKLNLHPSWLWQPTTKEVPVATFGPPLPPGTTPPAPSADTLPGRLVGISGLTPPTIEPNGPQPIPISALSSAPIDHGQSDWLPLSASEASVARQPQVAPTSLATIANTISTKAAPMRASIFAALAGLGYNAGTNGDMGDIAANVNLGYPDAPMIGAPWQEAA